MKSLISLLTMLTIFSLEIIAQKNDNNIRENPRETRKFAITSDSGFKSLTGVGLALTYYPIKNIAIDAGAGAGLQGYKGGVRARVLFFNRKFSPYLGLGVFHNPLTENDRLFPSNDGTTEYDLDFEKSTFAQVIFGFETMSYGGFVIGFNLGYSKNLNEPSWSSVDDVDSNTKSLIDLLYGSSICTGFNIGFAF